MRDAAPQTIYLKDYTPFGYTVDKVHLTFDLAPNATRVTSRIRFTPVKDAKDTTFFLHGENLMLRSAKIDGEVDMFGFTSPDPKFHRWCSDLFDYYWDRAKTKPTSWLLKALETNEK